MNAQNTKHKTTGKLLIAVLAAALVFTMMPLLMGQVFAEENTGEDNAAYLKVTVDGKDKLTFESLEKMKEDPGIKEATKKDVSFHGVGEKEADSTVDITVEGVTIKDLISMAGLKKNHKLFCVEVFGEFGGLYEAATINKKDLKGNLPMFAWHVAGSEKHKAPMTVRGQTKEGDKNLGDWVPKVTKIEVNTLAKPKAPTLKAGKNKVVVKWKFVDNADTFIIFRATKKNGKYKTIAVVDDDMDHLKYTDKKVKSGKTYYYKIRAKAGKVYNDSAASKIKAK